MNRVLLASISLFLFAAQLFSQDESKRIHVVGDSLVGRIIGGESVREVKGRVAITQGAVRITCNKAIQYLERNEAELIGNVVVTQDSVIIKTERGYYYGDTKITHSKTGVFLTDGHIQLNAKNGYYYFDEKRSYFYENVKLSDLNSTMLTDRLYYFDDEDKVVAAGNVQVQDTASTILADSLIHSRNSKETFAFNNVRIYNISNRLALFGNKLEDYAEKKITKIYDAPFLIRIDTTSDGQLDTLMISAQMMESYDDSLQTFIAVDSVKIVRKGFASLNSRTIYYQKAEEIQTYKREDDQAPPVIWNENAQLVGDSIKIFLKENRLDRMNLNSSASIITSNPEKEFRYDQISGKNIKLFFNKEGINRTEVEGNVLSIYYMYDENEPNGLIKSSSERARMFFGDKEISDVRLYGKPVSEYHPENKIQGKEKDFFIPSFKIFPRRPSKESLLHSKKNVIDYLMKDYSFYVGKFDTKKRTP